MSRGTQIHLPLPRARCREEITREMLTPVGGTDYFLFEVCLTCSS
jgi:hypothetical protein